MQQKLLTEVNPYLTFSGNCREALNFYKDSLGGEIELMTFESSPMKVPDDYKNKIIHGHVKFGNAIIMASDCMPDQEIYHGNGSSILINAKSLEEAEDFFNNLSEGGKILMPFEDAFWGARFGMFTDKYSITWMVSYEYPVEK